MVEVEDIALDASDHLVHFYDCESDLVETVGRYLTRAAQAGAAGIVIATEGHRRAFEAELDAAGVDPSKGRSTGTLTLLDAAATLARFMTSGRIDHDAFRHVIGSVVRQAGDMGRPVCAYGEMVALLWDEGNVLAAIELEELWNELGRERQLTLLCGYRSESVNAAEHEDALQQICLLHSSVVQAVGRDGLDARSSAGAEVSPEFPADPTAARAAREFISDTLADTGLGSRLLDDARLVVTGWQPMPSSMPARHFRCWPTSTNPACESRSATTAPFGPPSVPVTHSQYQAVGCGSSRRSPAIGVLKSHPRARPCGPTYERKGPSRNPPTPA